MINSERASNIFACNHKHEAVYFDFKREKGLYLLHVEWKYSVGSDGTREQCFQCFLKERGIIFSKK